MGNSANKVYTPKEISQMGALIMFIIPQVVTFYFFYFIVPGASEGHAHESKANVYGGPPKIEY